ncbi:HNH endonuclease signature motif containing protein [Blastococcus sp. TF02A-26]|uniref:HNH endonuclease signature motif containing protein n=1 Tax=Blastococcus sp. TF02A-26 TaxID=2250577 RepID=UPI000DEA0085|nr:HNH endonuclease signature motif containing protein [Blastococcus sp. TF02A-26]RBY82659.1 HNH endonuclease [Blastococcus sp. TF02A-26]
MNSSALPSRFWAKVDRSGECWLWTGAVTSAGYGSWSSDGHRLSPHRVTYEAVHGPIPDGLQIDHLCRVRLCVNPQHLEAVTPQVNVLRSEAPTAYLARQTHCLRDHELAGDNLLIQTRHGRPVGRECRRCRDDARARRRTGRPVGRPSRLPTVGVA